MSTRHFLSLLDYDTDGLRRLLQQAIEIKQKLKRGEAHTPLQGKVLGMIFEKSSTRTRVSFETGMIQLGGQSLFLSPRDIQLGRGEPIADSARVISSMIDIVMIRTFGHDRLQEFAAHSSVPVINGLTDWVHPCQLLADMMTWFELRGEIQGATVTWIGDGNNMCNSYINAAHLLDFKLNIACPPGYEPDAELLARDADRIQITQDPKAAAEGSDLLVTDVWASMGQEQEQKQREADFAGFQLNDELMQIAHQDALYMHCLPAHRGEEISAELMDREDTIIWQEAENRLHAQKALLADLLQ